MFIIVDITIKKVKITLKHVIVYKSLVLVSNTWIFNGCKVNMIRKENGNSWERKQ